MAAIETEQGRRWAESKVKNLTGGDKISARFMRQDFFEFFPQFKLFVASNHKPAIRNIDEAMKRRLHLIPFTITVPPERRDKHLQQKLLAERDGILGWAVQGCLDWQRRGRLDPPQRVVEATEEYFEAEDALGRWLEESCVREPNAKSLTAELFTDWKQWSEAAGEFGGSQRRFSDLLITRGIEKWRNSMGVPVSYTHLDVYKRQVTQQFNTTTSMGRLTLNILLSFAQFEREVTGERIRDKIAASKAKGMWMGGMPPLGYDVCLLYTSRCV